MKPARHMLAPAAALVLLAAPAAHGGRTAEALDEVIAVERAFAAETWPLPG